MVQTSIRITDNASLPLHNIINAVNAATKAYSALENKVSTPIKADSLTNLTTQVKNATETIDELNSAKISVDSVALDNVDRFINKIGQAVQAVNKLNSTSIVPNIQTTDATALQPKQQPSSSIWLPNSAVQQSNKTVTQSVQPTKPIQQPKISMPSTQTRQNLSSMANSSVMMQPPDTSMVVKAANNVTQILNNAVSSAKGVMQSPVVTAPINAAKRVHQEFVNSVNTVRGIAQSPIITAPLNAAKKVKQAFESATNKVKGVVQSPVISAPLNAANKVKQMIIKAIGSAKGIVPKPDTKPAETAINDLKNKVNGMLAVFGGAKLVTGIVQQADAYSQTKARLDMMNDGLQTTEELQRKIFASAQDARGVYTETASSISQMGILAKDAFSSNDELIAFMNQVNKQFAIAGTSAEGQSAAMLQLTQAMGSGVLRGEELNSIFEQAPTIIQTIAKQLGVSTGEIRNMAAEGQITADVVKTSLLAAADETNAQFAKMPMTFSQVWTSFKNQAGQSMQVVYSRLGTLFNSEEFTNAINIAAQSVVVIANIAVTAMDKLASVANFVQENWSTIAPIVASVAAAFLVYQVVTTVATTATALFGVAAQIASSPLLLILTIIALIPAAVALVVAAFNHFSGSSVSAIGVVVGLLYGLRAVVSNIGTFIYNTFWKVADFIGNCFNNPVEAAIAVLGTLVSGALKAVSGVASAIDWLVNLVIGGIEELVNAGINVINGLLNSASSIPVVGGIIGNAQIGNISIPRADVGGTISSMADTIYANTTADFKNNYQTSHASKDYTSVADAYSTGYGKGSNFSMSDITSGLTNNASSSATDMSWQNAANNVDTSNLGNATSAGTGDSGTSKAVDNIDKNTTAIKNSTSGSEEIKWLKIIAERLANNKASPSKIDIKIDGKTVKESSESALTTKLTDALEQYLATHTDGAFM